ncbi:MAG: hypothetical protein R6V28_07375 [Nitriliruptoraceae bacterium]
MTTDLLRVVVVSREPVPVTTVLRFKLPGCLPVSVPSVEEVAAKLRPDAIVLLDLGNGGASLDAARKLRADGIRHGIVVIGAAATGRLAGVSVLEPPFQLTDLAAAMEQARQHSARTTSVEEAETGFEPSAAVEDAPATPPAVPPESTSATPPAPPARASGPSAEHDGATPPSEARSPGAQPPAPEARSPGAQPPAPEGPPPQVTQEPRTPMPLRRGPSTAVPQVALEAVEAADESLFTGRPPSQTSAAAGHRGSASEPLRSKVDRWRKRLGTPAGEEPSKPSERELHERLVRIFAATSQIESIAAELPIVTDRAALYQAIVMAVADEFAADTAVLWRRAHNGWVAAAHRGLTDREASLPVGFDQPVLRDIDAQTGAILLDPTASFQHLITGIGGVHTESFMASSVAVGSNNLGILAVGRDEPLVEADLDRLVDMAVEAAVGIGVAEHIQRMSSLVGRMGGGESNAGTGSGQWREEFLEELTSAWHARRQGSEPTAAETAAGTWSVLADAAAPGDEDGADGADGADGTDGADGADGADEADDQDATAEEPETVIDLTDRTTKRV